MAGGNCRHKGSAAADCLGNSGKIWRSCRQYSPETRPLHVNFVFCEGCNVTRRCRATMVAFPSVTESQVGVTASFGLLDACSYVHLGGQ